MTAARKARRKKAPIEPPVQPNYQYRPVQVVARRMHHAEDHGDRGSWLIPKGHWCVMTPTGERHFTDGDFRRMFEPVPKPEATRVESDACESCSGTGHDEGCEHRDPAWDIGDLVCRAPCDGCCPNRCALPDTPLAQAERDATAKTRALLQGQRP